MDDLTKALNEFVKQRKDAGLVVCEVTAIDSENHFIDCTDGDDNEYLDVRLNATPGQTGLIQVPKIGSSVFIKAIGESENEYIVIHAGEIDRVIVHVEGLTEIEVSADTVRLGDNQNEQAVIGDKLNTNLTKLITQLELLVTAIEVFSAAQAAVSASGPTLPLLPGYTALTAALPAIKGQLIPLKTQLNLHLSKIVTIAK